MGLDPMEELDKGLDPVGLDLMEELDKGLDPVDLIAHQAVVLAREFTPVVHQELEEVSSSEIMIITDVSCALMKMTVFDPDISTFLNILSLDIQQDFQTNKLLFIYLFIYSKNTN